MQPTFDWLQQAEKRIRLCLESLRPKLLETQGNIEHRLKDDKSAVTEMDVLVENMLKAELAELDASISFSGEETGADYDKQTFWLVDPIDGTEGFMRGLPVATNMVTLIDDGQPVLSVIYNFMLGDYYLAIKGHGATCNGHAIRVSERPLNRAFLALSSNINRDERVFGLHDRLRRDLGVGNVLKFAAGGFQNAAVAAGALEAHVGFCSVASPWDIAPGMLLVHEAGGRVANIGSDIYDFRGRDTVAANADIFYDLMRVMTDIANQSASK